MKIGFMTFGCKVNTSEDELVSAELSALGFDIVPPAQADAVVVNTCAVTEAAAKRCASYVSSLRKKRPGVRIIVTGCLASGIETDLKTLGADAVVTNGSKGSLTGHIISATDGLAPLDGAPFYGGGPSKGVSRTRAFFKIQDGCDAGCAYCVIPRLRGGPRSKPFREAVDDFKALVDAGFKEIVLVGIHIGMYGRGTPYGLTELLEAITETPGDYRVRLSSVEVNEITGRLTDLMALRKDRICPHLHIPLQSGSDGVLVKMGRRYSAADYINAVRDAKNRVEGLTVGSDVIVGFPGEKRGDFENTIRTLEEAGADFIHVFPYSDRQGAAASLMEGKIDPAEKEQRASELRRQWEGVTLKTLQAAVGKVFRVLTEKGNKGHCGNYMPVVISGDIEPNLFVNVLITGVNGGRLTGDIIP